MTRMRLQARRFEMAEEHFRCILKFKSNIDDINIPSTSDDAKKTSIRKRRSVENDKEEEVLKKKTTLVGTFGFFYNFHTNDYDSCHILHYNNNIDKYRIRTTVGKVIHVSTKMVYDEASCKSYMDKANFVKTSK